MLKVKERVKQILMDVFLGVHGTEGLQHHQDDKATPRNDPIIHESLVNLGNDSFFNTTLIASHIPGRSQYHGSQSAYKCFPLGLCRVDGRGSSSPG